MKSPWKYLVGLTSRSRSAKDEPKVFPEAEISEPEALLTPKESAEVPVETTVARGPALRTADEPLAAPTERYVVPIEITAEVARTPPIEPVGFKGHAERALPVQSRPRKVQPRVSKISARPVAVVNDTRPEEATSNLQPPPTFSEEVSALDEEVRQLRRHLTEKLRLQNGQLERLLRRFDAS